MSNKLEAKMEIILEKKFKKRIHSGYDPADVDQFFDEVIQFLKEVDISASELTKENLNLKEQLRLLNEQLKQKISVNKTLVEEVNSMKAEGYGGMKQSREMNELRQQVEELKKTKK